MLLTLTLTKILCVLFNLKPITFENMTQNNIVYLNLPSISKIRVHLFEKCVFN